MSRRIKMITLLAVTAIVWVAGVWYFYNSWNTPTIGEPGPSGYRMVIGKEGYIDSKTGKFIEMSFIEAKAGQLLILSLICGGIALFAGLRALKSTPEEDEFDGKLKL